MTYSNSLTHGTGSRSYTRDRGAVVARTPTGLVRDYVTPEDYGALGDGTLHLARTVLDVASLAELQAWGDGIYAFADDFDVSMDALAWQAALYAGFQRIEAASGAHYVLNKGLHNRNAHIGLVELHGSTLDFAALELETAAATNLVANGTFASGAGWSNTSLSPAAAWVFGGGQASLTDPYTPSTEYSFGQFGQQVTLPAGKWTVAATLAGSEGASAGILGVRSISMDFFPDGVGLGTYAWDHPLANSAEKLTFDSERPSFDFEVPEGESFTPWLVFSAQNANWTVQNVTITPYAINAALWADGTSYGLAEVDACWWRHGRIIGPGRTSGVRGILFKSFTAGDTRLNCENIDVVGFAGGRVFSDQAYLNVIRGGNTGECDPAVQFLPFSRNAGENIRFSDHIFYNGGLVFDLNGGGEFTATGISLDYNDKIVEADRGAQLTLRGEHLEFHPPASDVAFDLKGEARVAIDTQSILLAGSDPADAQHLVRVEANTSILELPPFCYNLATASGDLGTGAGRIVWPKGHRHPGNALMPGMILRNFQMDKFGGSGRITGPVTADDMSRFSPPDGLGLMAGIYCAGAPITRLETPLYASAAIDSAVAHTAGAGSLQLAVDPAFGGGSSLAFCAFYPVTPGCPAYDEFWWSQRSTVAAPSHGPYVVAGSITTVEGSDIITITDAARQFTGGEGPQDGWTVTIAGAAGVGGIAAGSINGTRTIVERSGGTTWTVQAGAAATSSATGGGAGVTLTYSQTSVRVFDRRFWVSIIGYDGAGRPMIGQDAFTGEIDFNVPFAAMAGWTRQQMASWYTGPYVPADPLAERYGDGRPPAWATHMAMQLDFQHMRFIGQPLFVTDFFAN